MINLDLAIFLGALTGVGAAVLIFLIWRRLKIYGPVAWRHSYTFMVLAGLLLSFITSSLLESYRAPIRVQVSYQRDALPAYLADASNGQEVKRMQITHPSSAGLGLKWQPVYKNQLIFGAITLVLLLVLDSNQVKSILGRKELTFVGVGNPKTGYRPLNVDSKLILNKLEVAMIERKLYTDPTLNLDSLSTEMGISRYHLSQIMNEELDKNFYDLVNGYRVKEAIRMIEGPEFNTVNLLQLGFEVGFNSKASFYRAFKKMTNTTPAAYRDSVKEC